MLHHKKTLSYKGHYRNSSQPGFIYSNNKNEERIKQLWELKSPAPGPDLYERNVFVELLVKQFHSVTDKAVTFINDRNASFTSLIISMSFNKTGELR